MAWPPQMVDDYMWIPATMFPNGFGNFQTQIDGEIVGNPHHRAFFMIFIRTLAFTIGDWFGCQRSAMWNTNNDFDISSEVLKKQYETIGRIFAHCVSSERFCLNEAIIQARMQFI